MTNFNHRLEVVESTDPGIVIIDDHDFRRSAIADFILHCMGEHDVSIYEGPSIEGLLEDNENKEMPAGLLAVILSIGGSSLSDPDVFQEIVKIKKIGGDWPLIILADDASDLQIRLAMEIGANGIISTMMSSSQALATFEFIVNGGRFFPNGRLKWPPQIPAAATPSAPCERADPAPAVSAVSGGERLVFRKIPDIYGGTPLHEALEPLKPAVSVQKLPCQSGVDGLTERQIQVLKTLAPGLSNKQIARELDLSDATVKIHIRNLMKKLGASNRTQLALIGFKYMESRNTAQE